MKQIVTTGLINSFDAYLQQAYDAPLLTEEEEHDLACRFHSNYDKEAAHKLVFSHIKFVARIARNYQSVGLAMSDLIQEGTVGLMKAVRKFDPYQGVRLASFAVHWIKSEIHEFILKNWSVVKIARTKAQRKIFFNLHKFKKKGRFFTLDDIKDIAEFLNVSEKDVGDMVQRMSHAGDTPTEEQLLTDCSSNHALTIEQQNFEDHKSSCLNKAIAKLDARSRAIIQARWLTDDKTSLKQLAEKFGVSLVRIGQIEKQAINKLKAALEIIE